MPIIGVSSRRLDCSGSVISVGRDPGCGISFPEDSRLAPKHAHLRSVAGRWLIEATAGRTIRVGHGRATSLAWLAVGDAIHLTETGPELVFQPEAPSSSKLDQSDPDAGAKHPPKRTNKDQLILAAATSPAVPAPAVTAMPAQNAAKPITPDIPQKSLAMVTATLATHSFVIGSACCLVILVGLGSWFQSSRTRGTSHPAKPASMSTLDAKPTLPDPHDAVPKHAPTVATNEVDEPFPPGKAWPRDAVYIVRLKAPGMPQAFQLGTAWAVSPGRLITSAAVVQGLRDNQHRLSSVAVHQPATRHDALITTTRMHPHYERAWNDANDARFEIEELESELFKLTDPNRQPESTRIQQIKTARIAAEECLFQATQQMAAHDVGILDVSQNLPTWLALAPRDTPTPPASRVTLATFPLAFDSEDYLVDPEQPPRLVEAGAILLQRSSLESKPDAGWWLLRTQTDLTRSNCSGSPVLNSRNEVIGLYSRPTPSSSAQPPHPATHDIATLDWVHELAK